MSSASKRKQQVTRRLGTVPGDSRTIKSATLRSVARELRQSAKSYRKLEKIRAAESAYMQAEYWHVCAAVVDMWQQHFDGQAKTIERGGKRETAQLVARYSKRSRRWKVEARKK